MPWHHSYYVPHLPSLVLSPLVLLPGSSFPSSSFPGPLSPRPPSRVLSPLVLLPGSSLPSSSCPGTLSPHLLARVLSPLVFLPGSSLPSSSSSLPSSPQLFDAVFRFETLRNVIRSVTRNIKSIILTAMLGLILVYNYSMFGFIFYSSKSTTPLVHDGVLGSDQESCSERT